MTINDFGLPDEHGTQRLIDGAMLRRVHLGRLSNPTGSDGEQLLIANVEDLVPRPRGQH